MLSEKLASVKPVGFGSPSFFKREPGVVSPIQPLLNPAPQDLRRDSLNFLNINIELWGKIYSLES